MLNTFSGAPYLLWTIALKSSSIGNLTLDLPITKTIDKVIVHHSDCLHVRISDRWADETKSPALEIFAECLRFGRSRWNLSRSFPAVELGLSAHEIPTVRVEVTELFLNFEKCPCVVHGGFDLHPVTDDLWISHKCLDLSFGIARDFLGIKFVERATITFPLLQHERPVQSCLCAYSTRTSKCLRSL